MTQLECPTCLRELYAREIVGEALSLAIPPLARIEPERYHYGTPLQLETETETKARLRPLLHKYGMSLSEDADRSAVAALPAP